MKGATDKAMNLKHILEDYCNASGQRVNFAKSTLYFNSAAHDNIKIEVAEVLHIQQVSNPGKYLGLPTIWGRSRRDALNVFKERIWSKIMGWRNKLLNNVGKEVLIKAVITSIPTYAMNFFRLPSTWCAEINAMTKSILVGDNNGDRKIHWKR